MPTISIIVPVYNVAPYVDKCLASIANQTFVDFEVIVVDDGSSDGSDKICDLWADRDARFGVIRQHNRGLSAARNAGLDAVTGEYVLFVDSDDYVDSRFAEKLLSYASKSGCPCVICGYDVMQGDVYETFRPTARPTVVSAYDCVRMVIDIPQVVNFAVWNRIYRRSVFTERGIRFPEGHVYEDVHALVPILHECESVALVPDVLYHQHERADSITHENTTHNTRDLDCAYEKLRADVVNWYPNLIPVVDRLLERMRIMTWLRTALLSNDDDDTDLLLDELRDIAICHRRDLQLPRDAKHAFALLGMGVSPCAMARLYRSWHRKRGL